MTKKDFEMIAKVFAQCEPLGVGEKSDHHREAWRFTAETMAFYLGNANPRFDRARFLKACGMEE